MARLVPAVFVGRPNRFVVVAALAGGARVRAHLADPGRLRELLIPGAAVRLRPEPGDTGRLTRFTVVLVRSSGPARAWVSVDTTLPNRLAAELLRRGRVRGVGPGWTVRREVPVGRSRIDFSLSRESGETLLVEAKSVTLVENWIARFPDAPTARGARHLRELERHVLEGGRSLVLFVVQREDASRVEPNPGTDPDFARALDSAARAGVLLRAVRYRMSPVHPPAYLGSIPFRAVPDAVASAASVPL